MEEEKNVPSPREEEKDNKNEEQKQEPSQVLSNPQGEAEQKSETQKKTVDGENVEITQKSPKQFLKRKSKKVEEKKVELKKVTKRIDCWNPKPKETNSKILEKKQMLLREAAPPKKKKNKKFNKEQKKNQMLKYSNMGNREMREKGVEEHKQNSRGRPPMQDLMPEKLNVFELRDLYFEYHGENQGIIANHMYFRY